MEITTSSQKQTQDLGKKAAQKLQPGSVVALYGELGSGKTTFIQGLLEGLGITQRVTSPTFVFMKMYISPKKTTIFHLDLYRIENDHDIQTLGLPELLADKNAITLVEWPEKIAALLPKDTLSVRFNSGKNDERTIHANWF